MLGLERPPEPEGFADSVREARQAVERAIAGGGQPAFNGELWRRHKPVLARAQRGKCAFCETSIVNHHAHVDHFAPKAEVYELPATESARGREIEPGSPNVRGREPSRSVQPGYYWLAYEWTNFLVVCETCNVGWKRCYFPVDATPRAWPPRPDVIERPWLLNPFEHERPWEHFRFTDLGSIEDAGTPEGRATIEVCGLWRESLRAAREPHARDAFTFAREFARRARQFHAGDAGAEEPCMFALEQLCELGAEGRAHAGAVRAIAWQQTGMRWDMLVDLCDSGLPRPPAPG